MLFVASLLFVSCIYTPGHYIEQDIRYVDTDYNWNAVTLVTYTWSTGDIINSSYVYFTDSTKTNTLDSVVCAEYNKAKNFVNLDKERRARIREAKRNRCK